MKEKDSANKAPFGASHGKQGRRAPRRGGKDKGDFVQEFDKDRPYIGPNDIGWRASDDVLTRSAATLPFGYPLGLPIDYHSNGGATLTIPGMLVVRTQVTVGSADDYNSPANLASRMVYQINRRYNSGSKNYDISDLSLVIAAVTQALAMCGWLQRVYWSITDFSMLSRYKPQVLLKAQGVNYTDVSKHQAELAYLISWFGNALKSIALPNLPIFEAAYRAYSGYYLDDDAGKHQLYFLQPESFGVYVPEDAAVTWDEQDVGILIPKPTETLLTYTDLYNMAHSVMDVLLSDQDVGLIVGDTAKAWGENVYKVPTLTVEDCTKPQHSLEFLQQIHNVQLSPIKVLNYITKTGTTNTGPYITSAYRIVSGVGTTVMQVNKVRVDAYSNEPDPKEIINAFTLQCNFHGWTAASTNPTLSELVTSGVVHDMHLPVGIIIARNVSDGATNQFVETSGLATAPFAQAMNYGFMPGTWASALTDLMPYTNFDWHPLGFIYSTTGPDRLMFGDVRNLGYFQTVVAKNIHENSMLNLLGFNRYGVVNDSK